MTRLIQVLWLVPALSTRAGVDIAQARVRVDVHSDGNGVQITW